MLLLPGLRRGQGDGQEFLEAIFATTSGEPADEPTAESGTMRWGDGDSVPAA